MFGLEYLLYSWVVNVFLFGVVSVSSHKLPQTVHIIAPLPLYQVGSVLLQLSGSKNMEGGGHPKA